MRYIQPSRIIVSKNSDQYEADQDVLDALYSDIEAVLTKHGFSADKYCLETITLDKEKYSISFCESCGQLMVNRDDNPAGLDKDYVFENIDYLIKDGGTYEGKNICEECLPVEHRWGHPS